MHFIFHKHTTLLMIKKTVQKRSRFTFTHNLPHFSQFSLIFDGDLPHFWSRRLTPMNWPQCHLKGFTSWVHANMKSLTLMVQKLRPTLKFSQRHTRQTDKPNTTCPQIPFQGQNMSVVFILKVRNSNLPKVNDRVMTDNSFPVSNQLIYTFLHLICQNTKMHLWNTKAPGGNKVQNGYF